MQQDATSFDLSGRVALVTGMGRGLGQAMALALAQAGADIAGLYQSHHQEAETAIRQLGRRALPFQLDLLKAEQSDLIDVVQQVVVGGLGRLDILVNNAGIIRSNYVHGALLPVDEGWSAR